MKIWLCRRHCLIISVFYASRSCWHCILRGYIIRISRQAVKLWSAKLYLDNKYWLANLSGWTAQLEQPFLRNTFGLLLLNRLWKLLRFLSDAFHTNVKNTGKLWNKDENESGYEIGHNFYWNHWHFKLLTYLPLVSVQQKNLEQIFSQTTFQYQKIKFFQKYLSGVQWWSG